MRNKLGVLSLLQLFNNTEGACVSSLLKSCFMRTHVSCRDCPVECTAAKARTHQPPDNWGGRSPRDSAISLQVLVLKHLISSTEIKVKPLSYHI